MKRHPAANSWLLLLFIALAVLPAVKSAADDWPQWNGKNRDGKSAETGLLAQWPAGGPKLAWQATGFGHGYSTVSVVGDRLYTMGDKEDAGRIIAASVDGGKVLWSTKAGAAGAPGVPGYDFPGPRCTPTVAGELTVVLDPWGVLICVQTADGKEQWRKSLVKDLGGSAPTWGYSESPLVDGEQVVVTPGGSKGCVAALNKHTGELIWQSKEITDAANYSSVIPTEIGGVRQYVQLTPSHTFGVSAKDGSVLWQISRKGNVAVAPTPLVADGYVYVTSGYGAGCNLFKVTSADGKFSVEQVFANHVMVNHHGGVVEVGDFIYGYSDGKGLTCQNAKTGEAAWAEKAAIKKGSLIYADGKLYYREEDNGTVVLVDATSSAYREISRFAQPERRAEKAWSHPVIANGKLYIRDQDLLLCYEIK